MAFNPGNPSQLASVGYDNTVRLWDLTSGFTVTSIIEERQQKVERDSQVNAMSWKPPGVYPATETLLCVASVAGSVKIVDAKRGKIISRIHLTSSTVFETDWNVHGIVACSENCSLYFMKYMQDDEGKDDL